MKNKFSEKDLLIIGSHAKKASRYLSQINSKLNDLEFIKKRLNG